MKINEVENIGKSAFLFRSALTEQAQNLLEEVNRISRSYLKIEIHKRHL